MRELKREFEGQVEYLAANLGDFEVGGNSFVFPFVWCGCNECCGVEIEGGVHFDLVCSWEPDRKKSSG